MKKPKFQKEVFDPITAKLLIKKQELKQYLEGMTDKPLTPEARKSITNFFTTLSAEVAKDQLILLKKFFFQNEENNLSEKKQKATNWIEWFVFFQFWTKEICRLWTIEIEILI